MINIILSDKIYENDVYPLVKAFYPEEILRVLDEKEYMEYAFCDEGEPEPGANTGGMINILHLVFEKEQIVITLEGDKQRKETIKLSAVLTKSQYKNAMKRFLYHILSETAHKALPWGILTGIRPAKLIYGLLEQGKEAQDVVQDMKTEYLCSDEKIGMCIEIARREADILKEIDYQNGYSLYIGIPFCPSTCLYCSFTSYPFMKYADYVEPYLVALEKEIRYASACLPHKRLTTVYLGGGTPTTLSPKQLERLLSIIKDQFDFTYVKEFCVEAGRPDSITRQKLEVLKKWGVDRISINPQSMQQRTLDLIGRKHSVDQVRESFRLAREAGHDNINMDIIIGLPGEALKDVADTLEQIKELNPESLTVHTLAVKRAARLNMERERYAGLKAYEVPEMLEQTICFAKCNFYHPYYLYRQKNMAENLENVGYSKYGREGIYNILIMEEKQTILALGAGGMSKFVFHNENRIERINNVKSITDYIGRIEEMIMRKKNFIEENRLNL